jgi:hypothetical protein
MDTTQGLPAIPQDCLETAINTGVFQTRGTVQSTLPELAVRFRPYESTIDPQNQIHE